MAGEGNMSEMPLELDTSRPHAARMYDRTAYLHADLRQPEAIVNDAVTREMLDFGRPVALLLVAVLHFIPDEDKPAEIIATLLDALPPGTRGEHLRRRGPEALSRKP
jgi:hypothetical protein